MSRKFKDFEVLSDRQTRRRLSVLRQCASSVTQAPADSNNDALEENEVEQSAVENAALLQHNVSEVDDFKDERYVVNHNDALREEEYDEGNRDDEEGEYDEEEEYSEEEEVEGGDYEGEGYDDDDGDIANGGDEVEENEAEENDNVTNLGELRKTALRNAFLNINIKHKDGNVLLETLRNFPFNLSSLPKDTRTLLRTPRYRASEFVQQLAGREYLHIGFKRTLKRKLESLPDNQMPRIIEIDFSTDGAKVGRSESSGQFWPLQYRILNISDDRPLLAGIFKGMHKPTNADDFFQQFVQEIKDAQDEGGIVVNNRRLPVQIRCFIADAPARAFALNHVGHMASKACSKCKIEGYRYVREGGNHGGTMIFKGVGHIPRTDDEYQDMVDEDHHKGESPLAPILGLVTRVPFESLHLVYSGNCKKILAAHIGGQFGFRRMSARKLQILDARMIELAKYCPSDFNRRPNKLSLYSQFKGTKLRHFLLYISPAVVMNIFPEEHYDHFMLLSCVMRLLNFEDVTRETFAYCRSALENYVEFCEVLYGRQFLSYNVHALLHVVDDAMVLGKLESYSAFCYENNMPTFRKFLRKPHLPLQQFQKRITEMNNFEHITVVDTVACRLKKTHVDRPLPGNIPVRECPQFRKLKVGKIVLSTDLRDSTCLLRSSEICIIHNIVQIEGNIYLIVKKFRMHSAVYDVGYTSDVVGVYSCTDLQNDVEAVDIGNVKNKIYRMPKWSSTEGDEEGIVENEWICATLLTPFILPENYNVD